MKWTLFLVAMATSYAQSTSRCADLTRFQMPGAAIEITRAEMVAPGQAPGGRGGPGPMLPAHCRVNGIVDKRTGPDGKTYGIRFAVALPENWTGDFLQQGGGGLNGTVGEPIGNQAVGDKPALARGFVVASSDTGHQSTGGAHRGHNSGRGCGSCNGGQQSHGAHRRQLYMGQPQQLLFARGQADLLSRRERSLVLC